MKQFFLAAGTLWQRELVRFFRQRSRVVGALGPPVLFWFLIGSGLGGSFQFTPLSAPSGASIASDNITIYLERYLNLKTASSVEGDAGEWPDP